MGEKRIVIQEKIKKNLPEFLTVLLCLVILGAGVCQKQGYHMDELLSFELANARFTPWIVPTQPQGRLEKFVRNEIEADTFKEAAGNLITTIQDVLQNGGSSKMLSYRADVYEEPVWITGQQFRDYITVGEKDAFNYLSVYFNVKDDNHPPLHFMLLHTMSSLFRGKISPMLGCSINLAALAGILILLMGLGRRFGRELGYSEGAGRLLGIMAALCFGLSAGAMAMTLLIRMYALLAFFCTALFYVHVKKWQEDDFGGHNKWLIFVTAAGFWTQYFFLFYCLCLAAVTAAALLRHKKYRELGKYVCSMVIAGVVGVAVFPFAISDVFSSGRGVEALDNLSKGFAGYGERIMTFLRILADKTFGDLFWFLLLLLSGCLFVWIWGIFAKRRVQKAEKTVFWMLLLPVAGYFLLAARMSPYLVDRYMMPLFAFVVFGGALILMYVLKCAAKASGVWRRLIHLCIWFLLFVQMTGFLRYDGAYLYTGYALQESMAEENADCPCICVYEGVGYYENLVEFMHYEKTLLVKPKELADRKDRESITSLDKVVLLVKPGVDFAETARTMEGYGFTLEEILWRDGVHGDTAGIFANR
ncbi:MAG: hypothetical protein NC094_02625 [Bacteroidales bacterium]|nr:hypothetical protein [Lachnoclostridium sp.]MCM1383444.1 hypothetical protein [Lachnoclostridium sp.]MCM1464293.1 hypothetical protein [Bacteroidales bacterium]